MENYDTEESLLGTRSNGVIGVPITFLDSYSPEQFKIVGRADANIANENNPYYFHGFKDKGGAPLISDKFIYKRILIKLKKGDN